MKPFNGYKQIEKLDQHIFEEREAQRDHWDILSPFKPKRKSGKVLPWKPKPNPAQRDHLNPNKKEPK